MYETEAAAPGKSVGTAPPDELPEPPDPLAVADGPVEFPATPLVGTVCLLASRASDAAAADGLLTRNSWDGRGRVSGDGGAGLGRGDGGQGGEDEGLELHGESVLVEELFLESLLRVFGVS